MVVLNHLHSPYLIEDDPYMNFYNHIFEVNFQKLKFKENAKSQQGKLFVSTDFHEDHNTLYKNSMTLVV